MNDVSTSEHASGTQVLDDPRRNKGTALTAAERQVISGPARFLPIIYDPTVGEACLKFGCTYREYWAEA